MRKENRCPCNETSPTLQSCSTRVLKYTMLNLWLGVSQTPRAKYGAVYYISTHTPRTCYIYLQTVQGFRGSLRTDAPFYYKRTTRSVVEGCFLSKPFTRRNISSKRDVPHRQIHWQHTKTSATLKSPSIDKKVKVKPPVDVDPSRTQAETNQTTTGGRKEGREERALTSKIT